MNHSFLHKVLRLIVTAIYVPNSANLVTLMMEAISSSETQALTRTTRLNIPEDGIPLYIPVVFHLYQTDHDR
jgi:hypothetical protein